MKGFLGLLIVFLLFVGFGTCVAQTFTFDINYPTANAQEGDSLPIQVSVTSTYEIQSVTATVDGQTTNLVFSPTDSTWTNALSLAGLSAGQKTLTIVATDALSNSGQIQQTIVHGLPPTLTVVEPRTGTVARPEFPINVSASSSNNAGDVVIRAFIGNTLLATGTNILNTTASFPGSDGQISAVTFIASDSLGFSNSITRNLYVFTSTNWSEIYRLGGPILDVSTNAVLFRDGNILKSKSRASGMETVLLDNPDIVPTNGAFTSQGVIFGTAGSPLNSPIYGLKDGTLTELGSGIFVSAENNYAIWYSVSPTWDYNLVFYNVPTATTNLISTVESASLAPNGGVVYVTSPTKYVSWAVMRYRNGANTQLAYDANSFELVDAQTDGTNVIYGKYPYPDTNERYIALNDGTNETILATNAWGTLDAPDPSFAINAGWKAYTATGFTGINQVWVLSPTGIATQRTFFGTSSGVIALAPDGELIFQNNGRLYLDRGSLPPLDLGTWNYGFFQDSGAKVFWLAGQWYLQIGRSLFQIYRPLKLSASWSGPNQLQINIVAENGDRVITQTSTNLVDWSNVSTNTLDGTNSVKLLDRSTTTASAKFYRAYISH